MKLFRGRSRTFFADVTGDGIADAIAVSEGTIDVRPSPTTPPIFTIPPKEAILGIVPNVLRATGEELTYQAAAKELNDAGFSVFTRNPMSREGEWIVIGQKPSGGVKNPLGSHIELFVKLRNE